jgi:hypothetical protein
MVAGLGLLGVEAADALAISLTYGVLSILAAFVAAGVSMLIRVNAGKRPGAVMLIVQGQNNAEG